MSDFDPQNYQLPAPAKQCHDRLEYLLELRSHLNDQITQLRGRGRKRDPKPNKATWDTIHHLRDQAVSAHAEIGCLSWVLSMLETPAARQAATDAVFDRLTRISRTRRES